MKHVLFFILMAALYSCAKTDKQAQQAEQPDYPISVVDIKQVVINDDFWLPKISAIQDSTISYAFNKCDQEGRMKNFLIAGKQLEGKTCGQMPFDDTDLYKIIEGASNTLISKPNAKLEAYLDSVIDIIRIGQEPDGYLTTWFTIDRMNPPASWVKPSEKRWEQEGYSHELYNSGHLFEAAATHYVATGKKNFLDIALKNADLLVDNFGHNKLHTPPGHQIVETGLIKLYRITHKQEYLQLAKFFLDARGDSATHELYGPYSQDHLPVTQQTEAVGHAVRAVYMYAAMTDIAALYKDTAYLNATNALWENVVTKKMYLTGGIGAKHDGEAFGENYELPNLTAYNETCAAIGNVYWNQRLFLLTGNSKYYNIIERTLYNGLISGISLNGKKFFYPNPLASDGQYHFNHGEQTRAPWFDCSCCPTNLIRFIPSIPGLIYAKKNDQLFVNLYLSNQSTVDLNGQKISVSQQTDYPWNGHVLLTLDPEQACTFTLKLRVPAWAQNQVLPGNLYRYAKQLDPKITLVVNGQEEQATVSQGYINLSKTWSKGDRVELHFPMQVRRVLANDKVAADSAKVAFEHGPIVYCAEGVDNPALPALGIAASDSLQVAATSLLNNPINGLKGTVQGRELNLIPYYIWANRGVTKMAVWFPTKSE